MNPSLIADDPEAGPFSTRTAPAGVKLRVSTTALARAVWLLMRALPMLATTT